METITYKLEHFEGPLDLLLHLIEKNKIDIYDIPIADITAQYLDYVRQMEREDLNIVSEFLVMAATLLDIKAGYCCPERWMRRVRRLIPEPSWWSACWSISAISFWRMPLPTGRRGL